MLVFNKKKNEKLINICNEKEDIYEKTKGSIYYIFKKNYK